MDERRTLRTRGEVIEEYRRDFPREVVETYVRPLPWAKAEPDPVPPPKRKRRIWKGLLVLLAAAAVLALAALGVSALVQQLSGPSDWPEDEEYYYGWEQEEEAPITIPAVEADPTARLPLTETAGAVLTPPQVYERVSDAVVTVMTDLGGGKMSVGTGVIFREDGYLLTNHHVVAGGTACTVLTAAGYPYEAHFVGSDAGYDLAVLKIDETDLPTAEFLDSDVLVVGEAVYAIGTPLDVEMGGTFTDGIVSSVDREMQMTDTLSLPLIQTNAALNSGNSGGPLINAAGQVVGINFMKMYARYSTVEGLGFAIPSAQAERVVNDLLTYGAVQPEPLLGLSVMQLPTQLAEHLWGLEVAELVTDGAAERAGVQVGDYVLAADGRETLSSADVLKARRKHHIGDEMTLTLWRDGELLTVTLELTDTVEDAS